jgi:hypothetical protein
MTKLYSVKVTFDYVVAIEDDEDAESISLSYARDAFLEKDPNLFDATVTPYKPGDVKSWDNDCVPYGGNEEKTTGEILNGVTQYD